MSLLSIWSEAVENNDATNGGVELGAARITSMGLDSNTLAHDIGNSKDRVAVAAGKKELPKHPH